MRRRDYVLRRITLALLLTFATAQQAAAWGSEGHRIIADIAEQFLEPDTARAVRELLALDNETTLAEVSTWADDIRLFSDARLLLHREHTEANCPCLADARR